MGVARTGGGTVQFQLARRSARFAGKERYRGLHGHGDCFAAGLARSEISGRVGYRFQWNQTATWPAPFFLSALAELPAAVYSARRGFGGAVPILSGPSDMAYQQRVRHSLLLRPLRCGLSVLVERALRFSRRAQFAMVCLVLGP